ncbi:MAG: hypothetical protein PHS38_11455 [Bacteroidales bacterium]|nr:hypothetical protein [Bacteroidales bacterium]
MNKKIGVLKNVCDVTIPFVIYGIGMYARQVAKYLMENKIEIAAACVDTKYVQKQMRFMNNIPVFSVEEIGNTHSSFNVIIGFYDLMLAKDINIYDKHIIMQSNLSVNLATA